MTQISRRHKSDENINSLYLLCAFWLTLGDATVDVVGRQNLPAWYLTTATLFMCLSNIMVSREHMKHMQITNSVNRRKNMANPSPRSYGRKLQWFSSPRLSLVAPMEGRIPAKMATNQIPKRTNFVNLGDPYHFLSRGHLRTAIQ